MCSSRRRNTRLRRDWSSDVCSSDLALASHEFPKRCPRPGSSLTKWEALRNTAKARINGRQLRHFNDPPTLKQVRGSAWDRLPGAWGVPVACTESCRGRYQVCCRLWKQNSLETEHVRLPNGRFDPSRQPPFHLVSFHRPSARTWRWPNGRGQASSAPTVSKFWADRKSVV